MPTEKKVYPQVVHDRKRRVISTLTRQELDEYTANGLEHNARRMIRHLKKADLSKSTVNSVAVALAICVDKARLIRGQHTSLTAVTGRIDALHRIQVLGSRLDNALQGKDAQSKVIDIAATVSDNGSYCALADSGASIARPIALPAPRPTRRAGYSHKGKRMGRPPRGGWPEEQQAGEDVGTPTRPTSGEPDVSE